MQRRASIHGAGLSGCGGFSLLGLSQHFLHDWNRMFAALHTKGNDEAEEIRRLEEDLARVTKEREILIEVPAYSVWDAKCSTH